MGRSLMAEHMRAFDWSGTALGPVETWPQSLKTTVSTCLDSRFAIVMWWGKQLVTFYNDGYSKILGVKHPSALGTPAEGVWPEIWHIIGPMLQGVMERGEATWSENLLLELERNGYPEECYFTFSYSPIRDETGGVGGVFTPVQETTSQVIGERRLRTLRDLAEGARAANVQSGEEVCRLAGQTLANNIHDIPFSAFYLFSEDGREARLAGTSGVTSATPLIPELVRMGECGREWTFAGVFESTETVA
ncbi:MAG TPA: PAS domain-containing protein, partial [Bryobacteraceae bacterium]|nr:PAS domain-containing protein [Bryobacteraceae bacterium]